MRGGKQTKKKAQAGAQALLHAIWEQHGGPDEVARILGAYLKEYVHRQAPINWRIRGQVPHRFVKPLAEALNISPVGLNYTTLMNLSDEIPAWEEVVKSYDLPDNLIESILFLKPPGGKKR